MLIPEVVGFHLSGALGEGITATDLVLTVTQMLRKKGVVGRFVEFYGPGVSALSVADRATIANMAPEYGATCGFFPVDNKTLDYMRLTGRSDEQIALTEAYAKAQGLWLEPGAYHEPLFTDTLELDMDSVEPSLAGPKRPQDKVPLSRVDEEFVANFTKEYGHALAELEQRHPVAGSDTVPDIGHGDVVIAAITSCTNTSNPAVLIAAGLVARKARAKGLDSKPWVKTSLAPGSQVVTDYLDRAGLSEDLNAIGFDLVGYGCTTCIGNSGPLPEPISAAIAKHDLVAASVLSGQPQFRGPGVAGRARQLPRLAASGGRLCAQGHGRGRHDRGAARHRLGRAAGLPQGRVAVERRDPPTDRRPRPWRHVPGPLRRRLQGRYAVALDSRGGGRDLCLVGGLDLHPEPALFRRHDDDAGAAVDIEDARPLAIFGDSITTDHISPAGAIKADSPAGTYLSEHQVARGDFNSYGARRGNHEVMMRGTFANIRIKNRIVPGTEGGVTRHIPTGETLPIYDAAMRYKAEGTPLVIIAGKEYGTGSSRDWAAKGTNLLGVAPSSPRPTSASTAPTSVGHGRAARSVRRRRSRSSTAREDLHRTTGIADLSRAKLEVQVTKRRRRSLHRPGTHRHPERARNSGPRIPTTCSEHAA
jgi:aconitate hydratase